MVDPQLSTTTPEPTCAYASVPLLYVRCRRLWRSSLGGPTSFGVLRHNLHGWVSLPVWRLVARVLLRLNHALEQETLRGELIVQAVWRVSPDAVECVVVVLVFGRWCHLRALRQTRRVDKDVSADAIRETEVQWC